MSRDGSAKSDGRIAHDELIARYRYEPETGHFFKRDEIWPDRLVGKSKNRDSYRKVTIDGIKYYAHRLAWFYVHGYWPDKIDHIDHDKANNRICNLRSVDPQTNSRNARLSSSNKSGYTGVCFDAWSQKWLASIVVDGKNINLGRFVDPESANLARLEASNRYGFHENHGAKSRFEIQE